LRLRRTAIACRAANPVALGKSSRLGSSVMFNARELRRANSLCIVAVSF
jgi:hypothetical protein